MSVLGMRLPAVALLGVVFVAGLGGAASSAGDTHRVLMKAVDYEPRQITVRVGDTVEWMNGDIVAHTATAKDRSWDINILPQRSGRMVMSAAGTISYFCRYHPNMKGEIIVEP